MKKTIAVLMAALLALSLAACGSGSTVEETGTAPEQEIAGTYPLYAMDLGDGTCYAAADLVSEGEEMPYLLLNEDGTADLHFGEETPCAWTVDGETITLSGGEGEDETGTIKDGIISFEEDGEILYFAKEGADTSAIVTTSLEEAVEEALEDDSEEGSGDADEAAEDLPEEESYETEGTEDQGLYRLGGAVGDYYIDIVGAESFTDANGEAAIRIWYDFYNGSDEPAWGYALDYYAEEDGDELVPAYAAWEEECYVDGNAYLYVQPGLYMRCCAQFEFQPTGSVLTFTACDYWSGDSLSFELDPSDLQGAPEDIWQPDPITDPDFFSGLPLAATFTDGNDYEITNCEFIEGYDGTTCMRVYFSVTNNGSEAVAFYNNVSCLTFQDGVSLPMGIPLESVEEEDNYYEEIPAGETLTGAVVYELRSDSPIEFAVFDFSADGFSEGIASVFSPTAVG